MRTWSCPRRPESSVDCETPAGVAQLAEQPPCKRQVDGSNPSAGSSLRPEPPRVSGVEPGECPQEDCRSPSRGGSRAHRRLQHPLLRPPLPGGGEHGARPRARLLRATAHRGHGAAGLWVPGGVRLRERRAGRPDPHEVAGGRHRARGAEERRLQQCRPRVRRTAPPSRRACTSVLTARRGRVHDRPRARAQPPPAARLPAGAGRQLLARGAARLRPARPHRGRRRDGGHRRHGRRDPARLRLSRPRPRPLPEPARAGPRRRVRAARAAARASRTSSPCTAR